MDSTRLHASMVQIMLIDTSFKNTLAKVEGDNIGAGYVVHIHRWQHDCLAS